MPYAGLEFGTHYSVSEQDDRLFLRLFDFISSHTNVEKINQQKNRPRILKLATIWSVQ